MTSLDGAAPLRAALLDIDGTLADTSALISTALNEVLAEEGLKVSRDQFIAGWSLTAQDRMRLWTGDDDRAHRLAGRYLDRYLALLDDLVRPYDGMQETLHALEAAGVSLAVVTSKRRATAARTLGALDLQRFFEVVIAEEDVTRPKPDPEPLTLATSRIGVDLLARVVAVLDQPDVDGILGTADILEDLLLLDHLRRRERRSALLDGRVMLGSMNRGGLSGSAFEMDDRFTGYTADGLAAAGLDGGKLLIRIDLDDPGTVRTLESAARTIDALAARELPAFVEVLPMTRVEGERQVSRNADDLARAAGVATGLGSTSRHLWLKLPYCPGYDRVARATTCPIVMLGGDIAAPERVLTEVAHGMAAGPNVRGILMGRNVLYPSGAGPAGMAAAVGAVVHAGASAARAAVHLRGEA